MFSFGGPELLLIAVLVLLLFGPDKLPQLARTIGRYVREFNKYKDIMESTIRAEMTSSEDKAAWEREYEERLAANTSEGETKAASDGESEGGAGEVSETGEVTDTTEGSASVVAPPVKVTPAEAVATSEDDEEDEG